MKKFLEIVLIVVLFTVGFHYREEFTQFVRPFLSSAPCTDSIPYNLGTFDTKFNISKDYFLSALVDAEAIWEKPFGKQLFTYAPADVSSDVLKINLIYDYRQEATSKLANLGIVVKDDRASYDALKIKFTTLQAEITKAKNEYELSKSEATRIKINEIVSEINALVVVLNRLASTLNLSVEKYNTVTVSRGESFEEGVYISNGSSREIDIYEFSNRAKLIRVLAHELGHALGLDHVDNQKAIMYKLNQGNNETLTKTDLAELKVKCQTK